MRRVLVAILLCGCAFGCAEIETIDPPKPPQLVGAVPAVGRMLDLEVQGRGTPVRLRGVTGRVTAVCVLGTATPEAGGFTGSTRALVEPAAAPEDPAQAPEDPAVAAGEEPDEEAIPRPSVERQAPLLDSRAARVLQACEEVAAALADRIAVVALTTDPALDLDRMALRTYRDPGGKAIGEWLELEPWSQVILVDQQGRVADILPPDELHRFETTAARLVR